MPKIITLTKIMAVRAFSTGDLVTLIYGLLLKVVVPASFFKMMTTTVPVVMSAIALFMQSIDSYIALAELGKENVEYDFIVVGGGSAGAAVAARLSAKFQVLLLEYGGDPSPFSEVPMNTDVLLHDKNVGWGYTTIASKQGGIATVANPPCPRGKNLGGTSNLNGMMYMRGCPKDFDLWANLTGDPRWKFDNVEPFFKKLENYDGQFENKGEHGTDGPLHVQKARFTQGTEDFMEAVKELGMEKVDLNARQREGFQLMDLSQKDGRRWGTYQGYLRPILDRSTLHIKRYSHVTKILLDNNKRAYGVSYTRHGLTLTANCTKEVIVSAGAFNSPQLLMLSGIGPKEHLKSHNIETLVDLPGVGQNLQDHVMLYFGPFLFDKPISYKLSRDFNAKNEVTDFLANGKGRLSSGLGVVATGMLSSPVAPKDWPDYQLILVTQGYDKILGEIYDKVFLFQDPKAFSKFNEPTAHLDSHSTVLVLGLPKSRGSVTLKDASPLTQPIIHYDYLSDKDNYDVNTLVHAIKFTINLFENTTTYRKYGGRYTPQVIEPCAMHKFRSDAYWECYTRMMTLTLFHPSCTCAMGKDDDPNAVLDSQLRVRGVKNLRVADASSMPAITNANINAPSILIGEVAASLVAETWSK